jgi:hypothetical protein
LTARITNFGLIQLAAASWRKKPGYGRRCTAVHLSADTRNNPRLCLVARQLLLHGSLLSHSRQDVHAQRLTLSLCTHHQFWSELDVAA